MLLKRTAFNHPDQTEDHSQLLLQVRLDIASEVHVHWLNDLEEGRMYRRWSRDLMDLLRPMFPGQLPRIGRNLFNAVFLVDPASVAGTRCAPARHARPCGIC